MRVSGVRVTTAAWVCAALLCSCSKRDERATGAEAKEARSVQTVRSERRPMERVLSVSGSLVAREQANLSVKVAGRVRSLPVDIGSVVQKGDTLAQVEPRDYELRVQLAQAAYAQARAALGLPLEGSDDKIELEQTAGVQSARAVLDESAKSLERIKSLEKEGIASAAELDTAQAAHQVALRRYESAQEEARMRQANLAQRKAELDLARQQLTDTTVRAPFDGIVQARLTNLGEYLSGGAQVVTLVQTDPLRVRLEVAERSAPAIRAGQDVRLIAENDPKSYPGKISRVSPAITEANRMLVIEGDVPNPGSLRPGQFVRAEIILNGGESAVAVPANTLIVFAGLEKLVVVEDNKAVEKSVRTGRRADGWIEIVSGLKEGESVVIEPGGLRTGQPVVIANDNSSVPAASASAK